jgi:hypothetical protein
MRCERDIDPFLAGASTVGLAAAPDCTPVTGLAATPPDLTVLDLNGSLPKRPLAALVLASSGETAAGNTRS